MSKDINDLEQKIHEAKFGKTKTEEDLKQEQAEEAGKAGMHAGIEFVGAILIPTLVGLWIDKQFETLPFFMITLFFLGTFTGFYNVYKITQASNTAVGYSELHPDKKEAKTSSNLKSINKQTHNREE